MTERETPPPTNEPSTADAGRPTKIGVYDNPGGESTQSEKLVGMYDRPERAAPSPILLIVAALVVLALIIGVIYFVF
ncbi:MAG: hypothetical protein H7Y32_04190 [Chloroflexales bacterium]|nr:hypothetical protein [Chloroflexales bacterium]